MPFIREAKKIFAKGANLFLVNEVNDQVETNERVADR